MNKFEIIEKVLRESRIKKAQTDESMIAAPSGEAAKETAVDGIDISKMLDKYKIEVWNALKENRGFKLPAKEFEDYLRTKIDPTITVHVSVYDPREEKSYFKKGWFQAGTLMFITFASAEMNSELTLLLSYQYKKSSPKDSFFNFSRDSDINVTVANVINRLTAKPGQISIKEQLAKQKRPTSINDRARIIAYYIMGKESALTDPYYSATMLRNPYVRSITSDKYSKGASLGGCNTQKARRRISLLGLKALDSLHAYYGYEFPDRTKFILKDIENNFGNSEVIMVW